MCPPCFSGIKIYWVEWGFNLNRSGLWYKNFAAGENLAVIESENNL